MGTQNYKIYELVKNAEGRDYLLKLKNKLRAMDDEGLFDDYANLEETMAMLTEHEIATLQSIDDINLNDYGRQVKIVSTDVETPKLDKITDQPEYIVNGTPQQITRTIYLPTTVMTAYKTMNEAYSLAHPGRSIMLESGYRHPIVQRYLIVFYLVHSYGYSLEEVFKRVLPPKYSQHCSPHVTAVDLCNIDTAIDPNDEYTTAFSLTPEYSWLKEHGSKFGFYESYPEGNSEGIVWEPWHWQYRPEGTPTSA